MNNTEPGAVNKKPPAELEKATPHVLLDLVKYKEQSVVTKSIINKTTGMISTISFDRGEGMSEKTSPFDSFAQIIEGNACFIIDGTPHQLNTGEGIILPAHLPNSIKPDVRFKMLLTIIKSGYEM